MKLCIDGGHEQLISNGGRCKPAFTKIDKKQTMIDFRGISRKLVLKTSYVPTLGFLDCGLRLL
jgi:hypothetical protein